MERRSFREINDGCKFPTREAARYPEIERRTLKKLLEKEGPRIEKKIKPLFDKAFERYREARGIEGEIAAKRAELARLEALLVSSAGRRGFDETARRALERASRAKRRELRALERRLKTFVEDGKGR